MTQELVESVDLIEAETFQLNNIVLSSPKLWKTSKEKILNQTVIVRYKRLRCSLSDSSVIIKFVFPEDFDFRKNKNICSLTVNKNEDLITVLVQIQRQKNQQLFTLSLANQLPKKSRNNRYIPLLDGKFYYKISPAPNIFNNLN